MPTCITDRLVLKRKLATLSVAEDGQVQVVEKHDKVPYINTLIDWIEEYRYYVNTHKMKDTFLGIPFIDSIFPRTSRRRSM